MELYEVQMAQLCQLIDARIRSLTGVLQIPWGCGELPPQDENGKYLHRIEIHAEVNVKLSELPNWDKTHQMLEDFVKQMTDQINQFKPEYIGYLSFCQDYTLTKKRKFGWYGWYQIWVKE